MAAGVADLAGCGGRNHPSVPRSQACQVRLATQYSIYSSSAVLVHTSYCVKTTGRSPPSQPGRPSRAPTSSWRCRLACPPTGVMARMCTVIQGASAGNSQPSKSVLELGVRSTCECGWAHSGLVGIAVLYSKVADLRTDTPGLYRNRVRCWVSIYLPLGTVHYLLYPATLRSR